jgi:hypothetical protein
LYIVLISFSTMLAPPSRSGFATMKFGGSPAAIARARDAASKSSASTAAYGFGLNRASGLRKVLLRKLGDV